jgi:membrane protein DedA with SNARE-associated domain
MDDRDQLIYDACYLWTLSILRQLERAKRITAAELERIRRLSEQHYHPSIILL